MNKAQWKEWLDVPGEEVYWWGGIWSGLVIEEKGDDIGTSVLNE